MVKRAVTLALVFVMFLAAIVTFSTVQNLGWLNIFGIRSSSNDSQVVRTIERKEEVVLLALGIEGIDTETQDRFGIPGTSKKLYTRYSFDAKVGVDGEKVRVTENADSSFTVTLPPFSFIGYDNEDVEVAVEDGGLISFATPDVEQYDVLKKIKSKSSQQKYLAQNDELLRDQAQFFYGNLVRSVDPDAKVDYQFEAARQ